MADVFEIIKNRLQKTIVNAKATIENIKKRPTIYYGSVSIRNISANDMKIATNQSELSKKVSQILEGKKMEIANKITEIKNDIEKL